MIFLFHKNKFYRAEPGKSSISSASSRGLTFPQFLRNKIFMSKVQLCHYEGGSLMPSLQYFSVVSSNGFQHCYLRLFAVFISLLKRRFLRCICELQLISCRFEIRLVRNANFYQSHEVGTYFDSLDLQLHLDPFEEELVAEKEAEQHRHSARKEVRL